jgi:hypothetical protein
LNCRQCINPRRVSSNCCLILFYIYESQYIQVPWQPIYLQQFFPIQFFCRNIYILFLVLYNQKKLFQGCHDVQRGNQDKEFHTVCCCLSHTYDEHAGNQYNNRSVHIRHSSPLGHLLFPLPTHRYRNNYRNHHKNYSKNHPSCPNTFGWAKKRLLRDLLDVGLF